MGDDFSDDEPAELEATETRPREIGKSAEGVQAVPTAARTEFEALFDRKIPEIVEGVVKAIEPQIRRKVLDAMSDVQTVMRMEATRSSLEYIRPHLPSVVLKRRRSDLWDMAIELLSVDGLLLEFGVYHGLSINYFARRMRQNPALRRKEIHGFDSFEGLPELWRHRLKKGALTLRGELPRVERNVVLHKGWFADTVPAFARAAPGPIALLHFDADLYSSAKCVFDCLGERVHAGTVMLFDNYLNYYGWEDHEHRAFKEAVARFNWSYKYIAFNLSGLNFGQALVQITEVSDGR
jgi:hypothetical protein